MYKISINGKEGVQCELTIKNQNLSGLFQGKEFNSSIIPTGLGEFSLIHNNKSYNFLIVKFNYEEKSLVVRLNGKKFNLTIKDKYDELLHSLGMDIAASKKVNEIKAPMPGMILNILVGEGQEVKKGDSILILEAMKMENILKSPTDGIIKKITAIKGNAVEKNELLIQF